MRAGDLRVVQMLSGISYRGMPALVLSVEDDIGQMPHHRMVKLLIRGELHIVSLRWLEVNSDDINEAR